MITMSLTCPGEEGQTGRDRPQARWGAQAHGGGLQGQEGEEGFHDSREEEETQGKCKSNQVYEYYWIRIINLNWTHSGNILPTW